MFPVSVPRPAVAFASRVPCRRVLVGLQQPVSTSEELTDCPNSPLSQVLEWPTGVVELGMASGWTKTLQHVLRARQRLQLHPPCAGVIVRTASSFTMAIKFECSDELLEAVSIMATRVAERNDGRMLNYSSTRRSSRTDAPKGTSLVFKHHVDSTHRQKP